jgi:apolipoprotein N-acyltransferase
MRAGGQFGVPGSDLGYTQYLNLPIIQIARYAGVHGVSFLLVLCNVLIAAIVGGKGKMFRRIVDLRNYIAVVGVIIIGVYVWGIDVVNNGAKNSAKKSIKIAVIQPDIGQKEKLDPKKVYSMIDTLAYLSGKTSKDKPDIIIWPETAVMAYLESDPEAQKKVFQVVRASGSYLLTGAFFSKNGKLFNSLYSISPDGKIVSRYDKGHLMPFGEYLPFKHLLYPFLKNTGYFEYDESPGEAPALLLFACGHERFLVRRKSRRRNAYHVGAVPRGREWKILCSGFQYRDIRCCRSFRKVYMQIRHFREQSYCCGAPPK